MRGTGSAARTGRCVRASAATLAACAVVAACGASSASALPFANGGFETPVVPASPGNVSIASGSTIGAWTVASGIVEHGSSPGGTACHTGQCVHMTTAPIGPPAAIAQAFDTPRGAACTADFWMSHGVEGDAASLDVSVVGDGAASQGYTHTGRAWEEKLFAFTAGADPTTTLKFTNSTAGPVGAQIDDIAIVCAAIAVAPGDPVVTPDPGTRIPVAEAADVRGPSRPIEDLHAEDVIKPHDATLKICKVAGPQIKVGRKFTFKVAAGTVTVPAGPAPGGYCAVAGTYPAGVPLAVKEAPSPGTSLTAVTVAPAQALTTNIPARTVTLTPRPGVNVLTVTNSRGKAGYLEVCKQFRGNRAPEKPYVFDVAGKQVSVPAGACSPPILVKAGTQTITEHARPGSVLAACSAQPVPAALLSCNLGSRTAKVNVKAGDVSQETIVTFVNRRPSPPLGTLEVCKIAGVGTPLGLGFPIDVTTLSDGTIKRVYVPTGPAPKGGCVTIGQYPVGTKLTVADQQSYYYLWNETGGGAGSSPGTTFHRENEYVNPAYYDVVIGSGKTTVYFTNACPWPNKPCV